MQVKNSSLTLALSWILFAYSKAARMWVVWWQLEPIKSLPSPLSTHSLQYYLWTELFLSYLMALSNTYILLQDSFLPLWQYWNTRNDHLTHSLPSCPHDISFSQPSSQYPLDFSSERMYVCITLGVQETVKWAKTSGTNLAATDIFLFCKLVHQITKLT